MDIARVRHCSRCGEDKPVQSDFWTDAKWCIECSKRYSRMHRQKQRDAKRAAPDTSRLPPVLILGDDGLWYVQIIMDKGPPVRARVGKWFLTELMRKVIIARLPNE